MLLYVYAQTIGHDDDHDDTRQSGMKPDHAWRIASRYGEHAQIVARAIRKAQAVALEIADEADMDGRPGTARAMRRKAASPRAGDIAVRITAAHATAQITAYGVTASASVRVPQRSRIA